MIVSLDSDFLASGPGHIAYAKQFARRRKLDSPSDTMNRLYVVEPTPSVTGSSADHRLAHAGQRYRTFRACAGRKIRNRFRCIALGRSCANGWKPSPRICRSSAAPRSLLPENISLRPVHALAHAMNAALGNVGKTLYYTEPLGHDDGNLDSLRDLCEEMDHGKVDLLLILGRQSCLRCATRFRFREQAETRVRRPFT